MSPRAKKTPPKSKAEKPSSSKSVPKTSKKPHASLHSVLEGLRTPGDRSGKFDLRSVNDPWQKRRDIGKGLRVGTPRESHADTKPVANRPDPLDLLAADNVGRQENLIPLRMGRMAASPFTFLRGAACVMAWDLSRTPTSGIHVVMCGDAHINNFGLYGTPQRDVIFDLNDFDEVTIGPWEWDLKRLVASVNVAARENGLNKKERAEAVMRAVEGYRFNIDRLKDMGVLDIWYLHAYPDREESACQDGRQVEGRDREVCSQGETDNQCHPPDQDFGARSGRWLAISGGSSGADAPGRGDQRQGHRGTQRICSSRCLWNAATCSAATTWLM